MTITLKGKTYKEGQKLSPDEVEHLALEWFGESFSYSADGMTMYYPCNVCDSEDGEGRLKPQRHGLGKDFNGASNCFRGGTDKEDRCYSSRNIWQYKRDLIKSGKTLPLELSNTIKHYGSVNIGKKASGLAKRGQEIDDRLRYELEKECSIKDGEDTMLYKRNQDDFLDITIPQLSLEPLYNEDGSCDYRLGQIRFPKREGKSKSFTGVTYDIKKDMLIVGLNGKLMPSFYGLDRVPIGEEKLISVESPKAACMLQQLLKDEAYVIAKSGLHFTDNTPQYLAKFADKLVTDCPDYDETGATKSLKMIRQVQTIEGVDVPYAQIFADYYKDPDEKDPKFDREIYKGYGIENRIMEYDMQYMDPEAHKNRVKNAGVGASFLDFDDTNNEITPKIAVSRLVLEQTDRTEVVAKQLRDWRCKPRIKKESVDTYNKVQDKYVSTMEKKKAISVIISGTGTGKTTQAGQLVGKSINTDKDSIYLFLTARRINVHGYLRGVNTNVEAPADYMQNYLDRKEGYGGTIRENAVVGVDSILRVDRDADIGILVVDEFVQILKQFFLSGTEIRKDRREAFFLFIQLLNKASMVLIMDAGIHQNHIDILKSWGLNKPIHVTENTYHKEKRIAKANSSSHAMSLALEDAMQGKMTFVGFAMRNQAKIFRSLVLGNSKLTSEQVLFIHADSPIEDKQIARSTEALRQAGIKMLIMTPTGETGLDYQNDFDSVYVIANAPYATAYFIMQISGRARKGKHTCVYVKKDSTSEAKTLKQVRDEAKYRIRLDDANRKKEKQEKANRNTIIDIEPEESESGIQADDRDSEEYTRFFNTATLMEYYEMQESYYANSNYSAECRYRGWEEVEAVESVIPAKQFKKKMAIATLNWETEFRRNSSKALPKPLQEWKDLSNRKRQGEGLTRVEYLNYVSGFYQHNSCGAKDEVVQKEFFKDRPDTCAKNIGKHRWLRLYAAAEKDTDISQLLKRRQAKSDPKGSPRDTKPKVIYSIFLEVLAILYKGKLPNVNNLPDVLWTPDNIAKFNKFMYNTIFMEGKTPFRILLDTGTIKQSEYTQEDAVKSRSYLMRSFNNILGLKHIRKAPRLYNSKTGLQDRVWVLDKEVTGALMRSGNKSFIADILENTEYLDSLKKNKAVPNYKVKEETAYRKTMVKNYNQACKEDAKISYTLNQEQRDKIDTLYGKENLAKAIARSQASLQHREVSIYTSLCCKLAEDGVKSDKKTEVAPKIDPNLNNNSLYDIF